MTKLWHNYQENIFLSLWYHEFCPRQEKDTFIANQHEGWFAISSVWQNFPLRYKHRLGMTARHYFLRKDLQSVHWSIAGFASWVPTRIRSREQKFASWQWWAHCWTVHSMLLLAWQFIDFFLLILGMVLDCPHVQKTYISFAVTIDIFL